MKKVKSFTILPKIFRLAFVVVLLAIFSCSDEPHAVVTEKEIVETPEQINARAEAVIEGTLRDILQNNKALPDSFRIKNAAVLQFLYDEFSFQPLWSSKGAFTGKADSLISFLVSCRLFGLIPEYYHLSKLNYLRTQLVGDTSSVEKKT